PAVCSAAWMQRWMEELLSALFGTRPCGVVAHSLSGLVALRLAIARPDRVAWLAVLASAARIDVHPELREQLETGAMREDFLTGCLVPPIRQEVVRTVADDFRRLRLGATSLDIWGTTGLDLRSALAAVATSCLVIGAGGDVVI